MFLLLISLTFINCQPLTKIAADVTAIRTSQEALLSSVSKVRHASAWRFPEGPMSVGCLIMAAGVAFGICIICVWFQYKWDSLVEDATSAIRVALNSERRRLAIESTGEEMQSMETTSLEAQGTELELPPAYDEII